jgi:hypothetical protein
MPINPWLITWEIVNPANPIPTNLLAAILHNRTSAGHVSRIMRVLYYNEGTLMDQVRGADPRYGHQVHSPYRPYEGFHIGESPFLWGRHVFNFQVQTFDDDAYDEIAIWEDRDYLIPHNELGRTPTHYKKLVSTYRNSLNKIDVEVIGIVENKPQTRRKRPRS